MIAIPTYNTIILPRVQYHLALSLLTEAEIKKIKNEDYVVLLNLKEWKERAEMAAGDFHPIGVTAEVRGIQKEAEGYILTVQTRERIDIRQVLIDQEEIQVTFDIRADKEDAESAEEEDFLKEMKERIVKASSNYQWGPWVGQLTENWSSPAEMISMISPYLTIEADEKYKILSTDSKKERNQLIKEAVISLTETLNVRYEVSKKMKDSQNSAYREAAIQKQIEILQKELDDMDPDAVSEEQALLDKIKESGMPKDVEKEVMRVYNRFKQEGKNGHEYGSLYNYLEFVTDLSWKSPESTEIDLNKAREILESEHYGLKKIKERILQHIAVMSLRRQQSGSILLFVGAPGTGKTSMGKSIAKALDREYVRISLGGVRDEAEIRGHRRTYVGAMPGRIMDGLKRSGVNNPVMVLDEIDKLATSYNGDPASALLEVLDPEQNATFTDHYMNVPYDLSHVLFICTANSLDSIPGPLLDRMEVISLTGYTPVEKFHIAREHLLKRALDDTGIAEADLSIGDEVIRTVIEDYTQEAGVRGLKKRLDQLCRQTAVKLMEEKKEQIVITKEELPDMLGKKVSDHDKVLKKSLPGVVTGLAWTPAGGEILFIETTAMRGNGHIHLTGQLGDVMKESAEIAVSLLKSMFYSNKLDLSDKDIHIHVPSGAVPKDGPSAGVTLFTALTSLVTGAPADRQLAMTGEISLRGQVLPIGGLPEKLMAAERAGIKKVLIPMANKDDLKEVPEEIKAKLNIIPIETVRDAVKHALSIELPKENKPVLFEMDDKFKIVIPAVKKGQAKRVTV